MRTVEEHRAAVLRLVGPLAPRRLPVGRALGLVLAEDVVAAVDLPGADNSAMDGYAVRAAELTGAASQSPVLLPVDGDIAAGDSRRHVLSPGHAMRIMTGAPTARRRRRRRARRAHRRRGLPCRGARQPPSRAGTAAPG